MFFHEQTIQQQLLLVHYLFVAEPVKGSPPHGLALLSQHSLCYLNWIETDLVVGHYSRLFLANKVGLTLFFCFEVLGDGEKALPCVPIIDGSVLYSEPVLLEVVDELPFGGLVHLLLRPHNAFFKVGRTMIQRIVLFKYLANHLDEFLLLVHGKILGLVVGVVHRLVVFLSVIILAEGHMSGQIDLIQIQRGQHPQFFLDLAIICL